MSRRLSKSVGTMAIAWRRDLQARVARHVGERAVSVVAQELDRRRANSPGKQRAPRPHARRVASTSASPAITRSTSPSWSTSTNAAAPGKNGYGGKPARRGDVQKSAIAFVVVQAAAAESQDEQIDAAVVVVVAGHAANRDRPGRNARRVPSRAVASSTRRFRRCEAAAGGSRARSRRSRSPSPSTSRTVRPPPRTGRRASRTPVSAENPRPKRRPSGKTGGRGSPMRPRPARQA